LLNLIGPTQIPHGKEKKKKRGVSLINIHYFGEQNSISSIATRMVVFGYQRRDEPSSNANLTDMLVYPGSLYLYLFYFLSFKIGCSTSIKLHFIL
jgi:hypothetical protein